MALSSSPADPPSSGTNAATASASASASAGPTTPRLFTSAPPPSRDPRPLTSPFPQPKSHYHYSHPHHATAYHQPQPPLYTAQSLPNLAPRVPAAAIRPQLAAKPHEPSRGILYPVASSGRGFLSKAIRPQQADQTVTVANPGGFPPRPAVAAAAYPHAVRPFGYPNPDPQGQASHLIRPSHLQHSLLGSSGGAMSGMVKGVSAHLKVAPSQPSVSDCNGYKDQRDRSRDDTFVTVRDRKVRFCEGSSLYALCRSWLRNGFPEENQPQNVDVVKVLPKPSPTPLADAHLPIKKKGDKEEEEEDEESVDDLSPKDLLQRHIKRAKRVRAQLRDDRLQRIARYKSRLALLLPPLAEQQQFTNDTAAAN